MVYVSICIGLSRADIKPSVRSTFKLSGNHGILKLYFAHYRFSSVSRHFPLITNSSIISFIKRSTFSWVFLPNLEASSSIFRSRADNSGGKKFMLPVMVLRISSPYLSSFSKGAAQQAVFRAETVKKKYSSLIFLG